MRYMVIDRELHGPFGALDENGHLPFQRIPPQPVELPVPKPRNTAAIYQRYQNYRHFAEQQEYTGLIQQLNAAARRREHS